MGEQTQGGYNGRGFPIPEVHNLGGEGLPGWKATQLRYKDLGSILFVFFEKTMVSNLMVEANSALSHEVKMAALSHEVTTGG